MKHSFVRHFSMLALLLLSSTGLLMAQGSSSAKILDFNTNAQGEDLPAGTVITNQYADWGITISTENNHRKHPAKAILFNSSNPSGGDVDLGTPNEAYNGPGKGEGGETNKTALGNLLIVAENATDANGDGLVDEPDDEANGGVITFTFQEATNINGLTLVDIDKYEKGAIFVVTDAEGKVREYPLKGLGDNSVVEVQRGWTNVKTLKVVFPGSGAIAELRF